MKPEYVLLIKQIDKHSVSIEDIPSYLKDPKGVKTKAKYVNGFYIKTLGEVSILIHGQLSYAIWNKSWHVVDKFSVLTGLEKPAIHIYPKLTHLKPSIKNR